MKQHSHRHSPTPRGPFSRRVDVKEIGASGLSRAIEARPEECAAIAAATDLPELKALAADFLLQSRAGGRVAVTGEIRAKIAERCVVTLELFDDDVKQPIDLLFAPPNDAEDLPAKWMDARAEIEASTLGARTVANTEDQADPPEPLIDGTIDLGAIAVEFLSLAREPYPRKTDARFVDVIAVDVETEAKTPFAALAALKDRP